MSETILNVKNGFETNVFHMLDVNINTTNYTGCRTGDNKRYIYIMQGYGSVLFYKFDIFSKAYKQLANCPVASSTSTSYQPDLCYDAKRNRIRALFGNSTDLRYYDINQNTWSGALSAYPALGGVGGCIKVVGDYLYYIRGDASSRLLYRYNIATNAWDAAGTGTRVAVASGINIVPSGFAPGNMAKIIQPSRQDSDTLFVFVGGGTRNVREFKISTIASIGIHELKKTTGVWTVTSSSRHCSDTKEMYRVEGGNRTIVKSKLYLGAQETGTATGGTTNTLINTSKEREDNVRAESFYVTITSGTGVGQTRKIIENTETTLTVDTNRAITPNATSVYEIKATVLDYGTATSATINTLVDSTKSSIRFTNAHRYAKIKIIAGTGAGQERFIASHTATTITVDVNRTVTPDTTSVYEIIGMVTLPVSYFPVTVGASYPGDTMEGFIQQGIITIYTYRKNGQGDWGYFQDFTP